MAVPAFYLKDLAATYSRASYTGTTIGKAVFDGRVRDGIGSDHSFMATKIREGIQAGGGFSSGLSEPGPNCKEQTENRCFQLLRFSENYTQGLFERSHSLVKIAFKEKQSSRTTD